MPAGAPVCTARDILCTYFPEPQCTSLVPNQHTTPDFDSALQWRGSEWEIRLREKYYPIKAPVRFYVCYALCSQTSISCRYIWSSNNQHLQKENKNDDFRSKTIWSLLRSSLNAVVKTQWNSQAKYDKDFTSVFLPHITFMSLQIN